MYENLLLRSRSVMEHVCKHDTLTLPFRILSNKEKSKKGLVLINNVNISLGVFLCDEKYVYEKFMERE